MTNWCRLARSNESRRTLYRRSRRVLVGLVAGRWPGRQPELERAARRFLRDRPWNYLAQVVGDRGFALAAAATLAASTTATALPPVNLSDVAAGDGGFVINGIDIIDRSGWSVSGAGDVNGDGLHDLIVGELTGDPSSAGESYVVFGKADGTPVNLSDVISGTGGFESYVVFGKADGTAVNLVDVIAGTGGFVINGIDPSDFLGWSVSGAGDVNGDGLDDLIVGVVNANGGSDQTGKSYVVFGKVGTTPVNLSEVAAGTGGFVIDGIDPGDFSGHSVSGAGDVNGDGLDDLIVGAMAANPGGLSFAGESYVIFGKAGTTPVNLANVAAGAGGFVINGIDPSDQSGWSVSGAGDVNGDGLADLIVGAFRGDPGGNSQAGESYVIFALSCPWDCADGDGQVGIVDFLALLADWGNATACDTDGGGIGITDALALLAHWGPCP